MESAWYACQNALTVFPAYRVYTELYSLRDALEPDVFVFFIFLRCRYFAGHLDCPGVKRTTCRAFQRLRIRKLEHV